jgi:geranylgeranyl pyrophosphate synthase
VHDDLPCMDNDILRRWETTVWKKYWEYNWVLVWDLLNSFAFEILSEISSTKLSQKLVKLLSGSIWFYGMLWWQVEDLYFEEYFKELDISILKNIHNKKTWALIKASILWWIISSSTTSHLTSRIQIDYKNEKTFLNIYSNFWEKLWLAFQIKDDLLDVEWTQEETGKSVWWEEKWFVYFLWAVESRKKLNNLIDDCRKIAETLNSEKINFIIDYVAKRKK